jgi:hypothetical protein
MRHDHFVPGAAECNKLLLANTFVLWHCSAQDYITDE